MLLRTTLLVTNVLICVATGLSLYIGLSCWTYAPVIQHDPISRTWITWMLIGIATGLAATLLHTSARGSIDLDKAERFRRGLAIAGMGLNSMFLYLHLVR